jgi:hypothetical protein
MPDANGDSPFVIACRQSSPRVWQLLADSLGDSLQEDYHQMFNTGFWFACQRSKMEKDISRFFASFAVLDPNFVHSSTSAFVRAAASRHRRAF